MKPLLQKVKNIKKEACVSIILNTHRTKPESLKDELALKNLVKDAETRLYNQYEKRFVWPIMDNINKVVESIDHNYNLDSLVIYANQEFADFVRLPIKVEDRVIIDNTFATRDLIRAMHSEEAYYILVLSKEKARLIEAYADRIIEENDTLFPIENALLDGVDKPITDKQRVTLTEAFFNRVDKIVQKAINNHPLPILLVTESTNVGPYTKVADKKDFIIGHVNAHMDDEDAEKIVKEAWKTMLPLIKEKNKERITTLVESVPKLKIIDDLHKIWEVVIQGRVKTLFVTKGFFQPALVDENYQLSLAGDEFKTDPTYIDDIVDEMIEITMSYGGDIVFVDKNENDKPFDNIAALLRF